MFRRVETVAAIDFFGLAVMYVRVPFCVTFGGYSMLPARFGTTETEGRKPGGGKGKP